MNGYKKIFLHTKADVMKLKAGDKIGFNDNCCPPFMVSVGKILKMLPNSVYVKTTYVTKPIPFSGVRILYTES